jgi:hypothetical protein
VSIECRPMSRQHRLQDLFAYHYDSSRDAKLLDELDRKHVKIQDKKIKEEPCDELARELEKLKKESLN